MASSPTRFERFIKHDLWNTDLTALPVLQRTAWHTLRLILAVALEFRPRLLDARAAGLVFTTLLSLVPFLAVMFSVLKAFGVHHQIEPLLAQALEPLGPKSLEITGRIIEFVDNLKIGVLGTVGVASLIYTSYSLVDKIEQALNAIWIVRQGRPWNRKFTDYLSVVLVGPVLVFTAFGVLASLQSHTVVQWLIGMEPFGSLFLWTAEIVPFLVLCGVFTFFYKFIPYTRVQVTSALVGGVSAAILWGVAGEVFAKFVAASAKYSAIYSSFAVLILFLLWLYTGWMIILIGAQFSFFHQHPTAYLSRQLWQQGTPAFRERVTLNLLLALACRYLQGSPPLRVSDLAIKLNLPDELVVEELERLIEADMVGLIKEPEGVSLIKAPELITIKEVLDIVRDGNPAGTSGRLSPDDPLETLLQRRDEAVAQSLAGQTLRSLAEQRMSCAAQIKNQTTTR
ncbi:MAG: YihY/virulence factor BrkB family protein [Nitrospira sp.]|nr:YihY/virulence factor BrkB family protein [Nitrospira sp.]MCP9461175.1 YihY/virulence factor BrkB family protein [Nitrospira sp.]MCP9475425.1 YihY/virulence factor BrkB family protein [Nitrospira sp.]